MGRRGYVTALHSTQNRPNQNYIIDIFIYTYYNNHMINFKNHWYNIILSDADKAEASCMSAKEMSIKYGVSESKVRQVLRKYGIKPLVPKRAEVRNTISHWARTFNNGRLLSTYYNMLKRGITVCDEWKDNCVNFYAWAKENGYREGVKLRLIDRKKGYCPSNCKWV